MYRLEYDDTIIDGTRDIYLLYDISNEEYLCHDNVQCRIGINHRSNIINTYNVGDLDHEQKKRIILTLLLFVEELGCKNYFIPDVNPLADVMFDIVGTTKFE